MNKPKIKYSLVKFEKGVAFQILEMNEKYRKVPNLYRNKDIQIKSVTFPALYPNVIYLRGQNNLSDLNIKTLHFKSNKERDDYYDIVTNAIYEWNNINDGEKPILSIGQAYSSIKTKLIASDNIKSTRCCVAFINNKMTSNQIADINIKKACFVEIANNDTILYSLFTDLTSDQIDRYLNFLRYSLHIKFKLLLKEQEGDLYKLLFEFEATSNRTYGLVIGILLRFMSVKEPTLLKMLKEFLTIIHKYPNKTKWKLFILTILWAYNNNKYAVSVHNLYGYILNIKEILNINPFIGLENKLKNSISEELKSDKYFGKTMEIAKNINLDKFILRYNELVDKKIKFN